MVNTAPTFCGEGGNIQPPGIAGNMRSIHPSISSSVILCPFYYSSLQLSNIFRQFIEKSFHLSVILFFLQISQADKKKVSIFFIVEDC
jgi:hypothetical protein